MSEYALGEGGEIVRNAAARWMPSLDGIECEEIVEVEGLPLTAEYLLTTERGEPMRVMACFESTDPRPASDEVPVPIVDGRVDGGASWVRNWDAAYDLVCWVWQDTGRDACIPFRPLRETCVANWKSWCHDYRIEVGIARTSLAYWEWHRAMVPLHDLRAAVREYAPFRMGVQQYDGDRFCRFPCCPYSALYPCAPDRPAWCYRHFEEFRGRVHLAHETNEAIRAKKTVKKPVPADVAPVKLRLW